MLQWFARLWEIDQDEYWGYITNCGTEGNLHGILVGRENLPDGILYASRETHYSVFKCVAHSTHHVLLGCGSVAERKTHYRRERRVRIEGYVQTASRW